MTKTKKKSKRTTDTSDITDIVSRLRRTDENRGVPICSHAADEIEKLRNERDEATTKVNLYKKEHDALRAERDEVRKSYCSLMEAYRGGDGRVTANKLGWGYLFEEDKPCQ